MYDWTIDYITLGVYLIGVTVIGTLTARRVSSASTFFMGERRFGKWMMTMFTFGTGTSTDQAVTTVAKTYTVGASGIWYQWLWLFATPVYWLLAPLFRRMRAVTTADYLHVRYNQSVAVLFAIVGILGLAVLIGVMLKACGAMVTAVTGGAIGEGVAIYGMTILFVIYGVAGGLTAAVITDFIQGILTVALSFLILPFALQAVGGLDGLRVMIDDPSFFELISDAPGTERLGLFYVTMIVLNGLIGWVTAPHSMQMCGAGRTDHEARVGLVGGMLLKRFCTMAWVLTALCGVGLYMNTPLHEDLVWGTMARDLLPGIAPGLVGLFIASVLAAVMSSCDAFMVCSAALFTENIYRPHIRLGPVRKTLRAGGPADFHRRGGWRHSSRVRIAQRGGRAGTGLDRASHDGRVHMVQLLLAPGDRGRRMGLNARGIRDLVPDQHGSGGRRHALGLQQPVRAPVARQHADRRRSVAALADADLPFGRRGGDGGRQPRHHTSVGGTAGQHLRHPAHAGGNG